MTLSNYENFANLWPWGGGLTLVKKTTTITATKKKKKTDRTKQRQM